MSKHRAWDFSDLCTQNTLYKEFMTIKDDPLHQQWSIASVTHDAMFVKQHVKD